MKKYFVYYILILLGTYLQAQSTYHYDSKWYIGADGYSPCRNYVELDFSESNNVVQTAIYQDSLNITHEIDFDVTSTAFYDSTGNILFYTNGHQVRNKQHEIMIAGDTLVPNAYCKQYVKTGCLLPQGVLGIPVPGKSDQFYLFNEGPDRADYPYCLKLNMSTIRTNTPQGDVSPRNIPVIEDTIAYGQLTACKHANGQDYWVIVPDWGKGFYKLLVTPTGVTQSYQRTNNFTGYIASCQTMFTPDGKQYVRVEGGQGAAVNVFVFDFDRCTGLLSHEKKITFPLSTVTYVVGGAISPNSRMLYVASDMQIDQFDLAATDVLTSRVTVATLDTNTLDCYGNIYYYFFLGQLAPNGKIYFSTPFSPTNGLHVINYPDSIGAACQAVAHGQILFTTNVMLPNHPNYYLEALTSPCDSIGVGLAALSVEKQAVSLSPNPASTTIELRFAQPIAANTSLVIYNNLGQEVAKQALPERIQRYNADISTWTNGIYFYQITNTKQVFTGKWLINH